MRTEAVLFDADGVVQTAHAWRPAIAAALGIHRARIDEFERQVYAVERPALTGDGDFDTVFVPLLQSWQVSRDDMVRAWTTIEINADVIDLVRRLRAGGQRCCLASNQQAMRAEHMSRVLGYAALFDREFYSYRLRRMKPDAEFFHRIVAELGVAASDIAFVDDSAANVAAARAVGIRAAVYDCVNGAARLRQTLATLGVAILD